MRNFLVALKSKSNREVITFLVPIVSAIAAALWAVLTYFVPSHADRTTTPAPTVQAAARDAPSGTQARYDDGPAATARPLQTAANVTANNGVAIGGSVANSTITVSAREAEK